MLRTICCGLSLVFSHIKLCTRYCAPEVCPAILFSMVVMFFQVELSCIFYWLFVWRHVSVYVGCDVVSWWVRSVCLPRQPGGLVICGFEGNVIF
jgi:hypothetical protein